VSGTIALLAGVEVPGPEPSRAARRRALADLGTMGWPTRRREPWRYTDLEPLAAENFELVAPAAGDDTIAAARRLLEAGSFGESSHRLVLLDGERVAELGATALPQIEIGEPETRWSEIESSFANQSASQQYPLAALNTAFARRGLSIRIPSNTIVEAPIHLVVVSSARTRIAAQPRIVIELAAGAQATFVQHFVDCAPESDGWSNAVTQIKQAAGSRVGFYRFQRHAPGAVHTSLLAADLAQDAELTVGYLDLGARLVRNDIAIALGGPGARTELFGLLLAGAGQHVDDHTVIRHAAGATVSNENFRGIIGAAGRGVFNGKVIVERDCQRIDARQRNDNLLLGEHAEIDTKPELEIYANDVKCSHGATVGELDAEQLFYLRTRGLDTAAARRLLTTAFAATVMEQIADTGLRSEALAHVKARLETLAEQ
jgi:Fe-S cluster assembly protein SufD